MTLEKTGRPLVLSPSLINLDLCRLLEQVQELEHCGVTALHIDILDGYFSPSMPLGLDVVRQLRRQCSLAFDAHVMAREPDFIINELLDIGVQQLSFHVETELHIEHRLNQLKSQGVLAGVALKPSTSLASLDYVLERCDVVLLMMINPGFASFAGESQVSYGNRKICDLRQRISDGGLATRIEIDGRVSPQDIQHYGVDNSLADIFVAGSTCIQNDSITASLNALKAQCPSLWKGCLV